MDQFFFELVAKSKINSVNCTEMGSKENKS